MRHEMHQRPTQTTPQSRFTIQQPESRSEDWQDMIKRQSARHPPTRDINPSCEEDARDNARHEEEDGVLPHQELRIPRRLGVLQLLARIDEEVDRGC